MDIQSLRYVIALAAYRNFTVASEESSLSQSSFSKHIAKVESELGVKLFNRASRPLELTLAGEDFVRYAKKIIDTYDSMLSAMKKYESISEDNLKVGVIPVYKRLGLSPLFKIFSESVGDDKQMEIIDRTTFEQIRLLSKNDLDIAIIVITDEYEPPQGYTLYNLKKNELVLVVNKKDPISTKSLVSVKDLKDETFVVLDKETVLYDLCTYMCHSAGFAPKKMITCRNIEVLLEHVSHKRYAGIISKQLMSTYDNYENITTVNIDVCLTYTISMLIHPNSFHKPHVQEFIRHAMNWKAKCANDDPPNVNFVKKIVYPAKHNCNINLESHY